MRDISIDLIRVTEAAAIHASEWVGSGNALEADKAATNAIRNRLNNIDFSALIAIGEGKKDKSYGLFSGEVVGIKKEEKPTYDIAIDPIEGTNPTITSGPEAISTLAVGGCDSLYKTEHYYTNKLAYGYEIKKKIKLSLDDPIEVTIDKTSMATGKKYSQIMVCILDRPRHGSIIDKLRSIGVRIKLIKDCDVSGAVATCLPESGVDILYGIGGAPEAIISAAGIKCLGGDFQCCIVDKETWSPLDSVLRLEDLVRGSCIFIATGITDGSILHGVRWTDRGPITHSVFMRSESGTIRWVEVYHGN